MSDKNLVWFYNLEINAQTQNLHHIVVKPDEFSNNIQRKLYAQWNRIYIIKGTYFRTWTLAINGKNKLLFQFIVPLGEAGMKIVYTAHDQLETGGGGNFGNYKTKDRIQQRFYWSGWSQDVQDYVLTCEVCQRM